MGTPERLEVLFFVAYVLYHKQFAVKVYDNLITEKLQNRKVF